MPRQQKKGEKLNLKNSVRRPTVSGATGITTESAVSFSFGVPPLGGRPIVNPQSRLKAELQTVAVPGFAQQSQLAKPNARRRRHSSFGLKIPAGVMMPVINSGGVTSNPGFRAPLVGLATRT
jgi:hypothetical protein